MSLPTPADIMDALSEAKQPEAHSYASVFSSRKQARDDGWALLDAIFGLHERLANTDEPFGPMFTMGSRRSFLPQDLSDQQLEWLSELEQEVQDPEFCARLADMLWLCRKDGKAAGRAVRYYLDAGLAVEDLDHWPTSVERYTRSYRLATQLGRKSELRDQVLNFLLERLRVHRGDDPRWFSLKIMLLLYEARHGDHDELLVFAQTAVARAEGEGDFRRQRDYLNFIIKLHHRKKDTDAEEEARVNVARSFKAEAEVAEINGTGVNSHHFWEDAVKAYRERASLKDQVPALQKRLAAAGRAMLDSMKEHSHSTDISELVKHLQAQFSGQSADVALCRLVMFGLNAPDSMREEVEKSRGEFIASMFQTRIFDYEGRTVAVAPGGLSPDDPGYEERVKADIQRNMSTHRGFAAQAQIGVAMRIITSEHIFDSAFLGEKLADSKFIPEGRLEHYAKGLSYGFEWQLDHSTLFLVPQFEAGLRNIATQIGLIPRNVQPSGVEEAWGLDRLLSEADMVTTLGSSLVFELRSLLIEDYGPKFRHNVAHGLVPPAALQGTDAMYAWWLFLKLCVMPTSYFKEYAAQQITDAPQDEAEEKPSQDETAQCTASRHCK